jgi:hypothetical protein
MLKPIGKSRQTRFELALIAVLLVSALAIATNGILNARKYPNLPVEAEPYEMPPDCPYPALRASDQFPKRCVAPRYRLRNATELGLITVGRNTRWYRAGDDAVLLMCAGFGKFCDVRDRVHGKFVRPNYYRDIQDKKHLNARR